MFEEPINDEEYYRCPIKFIPKSVWTFLRIEKYNKMCSVPGIRWAQQSARYTEFKLMYEAYCKEAEQYRQMMDRAIQRGKK